jgi:hypothetical protein
MPTAWRAIVAALVAVIALAAGCDAGDPTLPAAAVEVPIADQYRARNGGIGLEELRCQQTAANVGAIFTCMGRNDRGVDVMIVGEVSALDESAGRARYRWEVVRAQAPGDLFERAALRALRGGGGAPVAAVDCPTTVALIAGTRVRCRAIGPRGGERPIVLVLTDRSGSFRVVGM